MLDAGFISLNKICQGLRNRQPTLYLFFGNRHRCESDAYPVKILSRRKSYIDLRI